MTALVSALDAALLHLVWQGLVMAMLLWITLAALRKRSANARYLAGCAALGLLAILPVMTAWMAYTRSAPDGGAPISIVAIAAMVRPMPAQVDWFAVVRTWLVPTWACGVLLLSMRMLWGCAKVAGLKRQGEAAEPALLAMVAGLAARIRVTRPVRVLMSSLADGPSVVGWLRPVLLLPAATVLGLRMEQLEAVLAHELAHIRRHDYLVNMLQMLVETLFFYHPAVWWISRRIRDERELCCDDIAVRSCGDAVCYARALAALERMRVVEAGLMFGAALGAQDGPLQYRIERLLGITRREEAPSRLPGMIAICLGLACFAPATNPVKAQVALPSAPMPQAPLLVSSQPAQRMIAQVIQPGAPAPVPSPLIVPVATGESVFVEVTVDRNGDASDAHVISGPIESRRTALLAALTEHFPQDGPAIRYVTIPVDARPLFGVPNGVKRVLTPDEAQARVAVVNLTIAKLKAQQAEASEKGAAQLQETIEKNMLAVEDLQKVAAGQNSLLGKKLEDIHISGFGVTDDARGRLLARLPLRLHDILSEESMNTALRVAKQEYPNAEVYFGAVGLDAAGLVVNIPRERSASAVR